MGYDQRTFPDTQSCQIYFCCFPLALENIGPWPLLPFSQISLKNSELEITHSTFRDCCLHCLFPTSFLDIAICIIMYMWFYHLSLWTKSYGVTLQMHPIRYYFYVVLFCFSAFYMQKLFLLNNDFWPWVIIQAFTIIIVMYTRVFNENRWPAKLAGYFT